MKKQIFISFLIVAFFNYISGCSITKTERITPDKLSLSKEIIEEVVLLNMDVIKFDKNGARYENIPEKITGKLKDGRSAKFFVDQVKELWITTGNPIKPTELKNQNIIELQLKNNRLITFDSSGGKYNEKEKYIFGIDENQNKVSFPIDRVSEIFTDKATTINVQNINYQKDLGFKALVTKENNLLFVFDEGEGKLFPKDQKIIGFDEKKNLVSINPDSVLYLNVNRSDVTGSILASVGVIALILGTIAVIIAATKESCPFIYSYDGDRYVLDAEPLGGATTKGLERTDYSKMDYLTLTDNKYKIFVRNEVEETQYIDELALLSVKHDEDKEVFPDLIGNFYQIKNPYIPLSAKDENGMSLLKAVCADDNLYWQTKLPIDSNSISKNQRHELIFTFPNPNNKSKAKLVANVGTSLWGSRMIREMLQLYGNSIDYYYKKIDDQGTEYRQMMNFIESEELYKLKYYIKGKDGWNFQGFINGGGPLVSETRVYDLDLSSVKSDSVTIKINPPFGFWTIDYLAIQYDEFTTPVIERINLQTATNQEEIEVNEPMEIKDQNYYVMPNVGDYFEATFTGRENTVDSKTTLYLKSSGYYEIHLDKTLPVQVATLSKFIFEPGYIIKFSNKRYSEWKKLNN